MKPYLLEMYAANVLMWFIFTYISTYAQKYWRRKIFGVSDTWPDIWTLDDTRFSVQCSY